MGNSEKQQPGLMARLDERTNQLNEVVAHLEDALYPVLAASAPDSVRVGAGASTREQAPRLTLEQMDERLALLTGRLRSIITRVSL